VSVPGAFAELLAPSICAGCSGPGQGLCARCRGLLPSRVWPADAPEGCRSAWFVAPYDHVLGGAWRRGKYYPDPTAVDAVVQAARDAVVGLPRVDAVVPVPQDWMSSFRRGFNPVDRLATSVAEELGVERRRLLKRRRGPAQASLGQAERLDAAMAAFRMRQPTSPERVLLVDDVMTTGATATACASELLCAGAREVHLLVVCWAFA
jgi:predicted amidophosphoribosyltransferase